MVFTKEVSGLTPAVRYMFEVAARNSRGRGAAAELSEAVLSPNIAPIAAPTAFTAVLDSTSEPTMVTLRWRMLRDDQFGGFPNTGITYEVQFRDIVDEYGEEPLDNGLAAPGLQDGSTLYFQAVHTPSVVFGAGRTFNYQVRASNGKGKGPWSSERSVSTDAAVPDAPRALTATAGLMQITISWAKPVHDGGSPLLRYELHVYSDDVETSVPAAETETPTTLLRLPSTQSSFEHTSLDVDRNYFYRIRAVNNIGEGPFTEWTAENSPVEIVDGAPGALASFVVSGSTATTLMMTWGAPTTIGNSPISGYQVQRRAGDSTDIHDFADVAGSPLGPTATTYTDKDLTPDTSYDYRARARNGSGPGPWADDGDTSTSVKSSPTAPRDLTAEAAGPTSIMLTWTVPESDNGSPITGYQLQRRTGGVAFADVETNIPLEAAARQYTDDFELASGIAYDYQIRALTADPNNSANDGQQGAYSAQASATTSAGIPDAPTVSTVSPTTTENSETTSLTLTWTEPASSHGRTITGYRIDRWAYYAASNSWDWAFLADAADDATSYMDNDPANDNDEELMPNTRYFYRVRAKTGDGTVEAEQGKWSDWESGRTALGVPTAPRDLTAEAAGPTSIMLTWTAPESDNGRPIVGYVLQRRVPPAATWNDAEMNIPLGSSRYTDTGLVSGTEYEYRIRAKTTANGDPDADQGAWSAESDSATTVQGIPAAPGNMMVDQTGMSESTSLEIMWDAVDHPDTGKAITGYRIERWAFNTASSSWGWEFVVDAANDATTYDDGGRSPNTTYYYRVRAKTGDGMTEAEQGTWSTPTFGRTNPGVPAAPQLSAATVGMEEIRLSWTVPAANGRTITGYKIERWDPVPDNETTKAWADRIVVAASLTAWNDSGLDAGTAYYYRIRAETGAGGEAVDQGAWSTTANASTVSSVPGRPDLPRPTGDDVITSTSVTLTWTAPDSDGGARLIGYHVQRWSSAGWQIISSGLVDGVTYADMDVEAETTYYYRVRAVNTNGEGLWSTPFVRVDTPE